MIDPDILKKYEIDSDGLKKLFSGKYESLTPKVQKLIDTFQSRCQGGRDMNFEHYPRYKALDLAWDASLNQITPTLLASLCDRSADGSDVLDILKSYNLNPADVTVEVPDPKTPGKNIKKVSSAAFTQVTVPLCMAYIKIRWAKIINDRRMVPLFKYDPVISDQISRLRCDVITSRIEHMSRQMGYFEVMKQQVFRMLHYGECLTFPIEEWFTECAVVEKGSPYPAVEDDELKSEKDGSKTIVVKEGLRYHMPHPSRTYYDRTYFASTFNTDTGCSYAGYWRVLPFREIMRNKDRYWNMDDIPTKDFYEWFKGKNTHSYWTNVLQGCAMNFPGAEDTNAAVSKNDNEKSIAGWYSADIQDRPIVITEHFEKLVPKDWGLGDYPHPVWFRFTLAADTTVIYAAPICYNPINWMGYDFAEGRTHNASMTLECLPFQDQFSNLLTQHLLTIRQNLTNATFIDTDIFDEKDIKAMENWGERFWRRINIIRASFKQKFQKQLVGNGGQQPPVVHVKFPYQDANAILQAMRTILDTLERVLVMSAQEVGQSASHEQTREEVKHISQNTNTRVVFTSIAVDISRDTWKHQLYDALMAYGQKSFYAQVAMDSEIKKDDLEKLGFTYKSPYDEKSKKAYLQVTDKKTAIAYESFVSDRDGDDRVNDVETGKNIIALLQQVMAKPEVFAAIGAEQVVELFNYAAKFLGMPRDFKLVNTGQAQDFQQQVQQAIQQLGQAIQSMQEDIKGALKPIMEKNVEQDQELHKVMVDFEALVKGLADLGIPVAQQQGQPQQQPAPQQPQIFPATTGDMQVAGLVGG
jgi:hypothetical protein